MCNLYPLLLVVSFLQTSSGLQDSKVDVVTCHMYQPTKGQTDASPLITASGYKINPRKINEEKIIAISRDLLKKYPFGTVVRIENAGKHGGIYVVRDLMHERWTKKIDILVGPKEKITTYRKVKMSKVAVKSRK